MDGVSGAEEAGSVGGGSGSAEDPAIEAEDDGAIEAEDGVGVENAIVDDGGVPAIERERESEGAV